MSCRKIIDWQRLFECILQRNDDDVVKRIHSWKDIKGAILFPFSVLLSFLLKITQPRLKMQFLIFIIVFRFLLSALCLFSDKSSSVVCSSSSASSSNSHHNSNNNNNAGNNNNNNHSNNNANNDNHRSSAKCLSGKFRFFWGWCFFCPFEGIQTFIVPFAFVGQNVL